MNYNKPIAPLHDLLDYNAQKFTAAEIEPAFMDRTCELKLKTDLQKYLDLVQEHVQEFGSFFEEEKISSLSVLNKIMLAFIEETNEKLNNYYSPVRP